MYIHTYIHNDNIVFVIIIMILMIMIIRAKLDKSD